MKKPLIFAASICLLSAACAHTDNHTTAHHQEVKYPVGDISTDQLLNQSPLFAKEYASYQVDVEQVAALNQKLAGKAFNLNIYFGTWCHDSQREVPRMLKLLENNNNVEIKLIALDYQKQEPQGRAKGAGIKFTPTFVLVDNQGSELGRIIERPSKDLASDLLAIL